MQFRRPYIWLAAGVLDGLLEHEGEDLTSVDAIVKMVPPLHRALQSYRDRAAAQGWAPAAAVGLDAAVQGWYAFDDVPPSDVTCFPQ